MDRSLALPYVSFVVDDALCARPLGADQHAIVREAGAKFEHASRLIGWSFAFGPLFVAVHSYLDCALSDAEAIELATDYLAEIDYFADEPTAPDFVL
jgi:hypothetical protein